MKPVDGSLLVQKDGGGTGDQAKAGMFLSNAQLPDRLAGGIAQEEEGNLSLFALFELLGGDQILLFYIAAELGDQVGIIDTDPDDLGTLRLKLRKFPS